MPSLPHEVPLALFRECPELIPLLLRERLHMPLPAYAGIAVVEADFTQVVPTEYRADLVLTLLGADGKPVMGLIVEVQRHRDPRKRYTWPLYAAELHARLQCPVCLLVFSDDDAVAAWAREPIETLQLGSSFRPLVVGPGDVPRVTAPAEVGRLPELAVLSAIAHGNDEHGLDVVLAAFAAVAHLDAEHQKLYIDIIHRALNDAARAVLESLMKSGKYEYKSEFALTYINQGLAQGLAQGRAEGKAEGKAEGAAEGRAAALLSVLSARGISLTDEQQGRVRSCTDIATLDRWIARAAVAASAADIFGDN